MISQQQLALLNKFQHGNFDIIINGEVDNQKRYVYFITVKCDSSDEELLYSKNKNRREFISIDTVYRYVVKNCINARKIVIRVQKLHEFNHLKEITFEITANEFDKKLMTKE